MPIAVGLVLLILLQFGVVQTLRVSSVNMVPTLAPDDHVMVRAYGSEPALGDVVVYRSPFDYDHLQLGRIVAVEGEQVELAENGLHLDGRAAATQPASSCESAACEATENLIAVETVGGRSFYTRRADGLSSLMFDATVVPPGHVFVLSDNRVDERDSRIYGAIPHGAIVGVLSFVYYAFDETGIRWDRMNRPVS
ncbi:MAG: signal peptidase I [Candidatus Binatia bacterium]